MLPSRSSVLWVTILVTIGIDIIGAHSYCVDCTSEQNVKNQDSCIQPIDSGTCQEQNATKWAYDCGEEKCTEFTYGGCGGNDNIFDSMELCEQSCGEGQPCPIVKGPGSTVKRLRRSPKKKSKHFENMFRSSSEEVSDEKISDDTSFSSSTSMSHEAYSGTSEQSSSEEHVTSEEDNTWRKSKRTRKLKTKRRGYTSRRETNKRTRVYS